MFGQRFYCRRIDRSNTEILVGAFRSNVFVHGQQNGVNMGFRWEWIYFFFRKCLSCVIIISMTFRYTRYLSTVIFVLLASVCSFAQSGPNMSAIKLFDTGDLAGAVEALKSSDNFIDLNYLGYAYEKLGKGKEARNAFDRSFKNGYKEFGEEILARSSFDKDRPAPVEKLSEFLTNSSQNVLIVALSARRTMELKGPTTNENEWLMRARMFSEIGRILASGKMLFSQRELDIPAKILTRGRAGYTDEARSSRTEGTIKLLVLFDTDGKVKAAIPVEGLSHGLNEQAIIAASKITFTPAERKGVPVPTLQAMSYSFSIR